MTSTGAIKDTYDIRDYQYVAGAGEFDWESGFDILNVLGHDLIVKDQNGSSSCGGQAWAYYGEVLESINTGNYEPRSARWIYSHTWAPGGGSNGRDNCDHVIKRGWLQEKYATSYENGKAPSEKFMRQKPENVPDDTGAARALSYLMTDANIDRIANAVKDNYGCILLVEGEDNGTWRTEFPKPPTGSNPWRHWLYAGKVKLIDGKKHIGVINSWGKKTGDDGWQWLSEDYFKSGHVQYGWTLAWDYRPAKLKLLMIQAVRLMKQLLAIKRK